MATRRRRRKSDRPPKLKSEVMMVAAGRRAVMLCKADWSLEDAAEDCHRRFGVNRLDLELMLRKHFGLED